MRGTNFKYHGDKNTVNEGNTRWIWVGSQKSESAGLQVQKPIFIKRVWIIMLWTLSHYLLLFLFYNYFQCSSLLKNIRHLSIKMYTINHLNKNRATFLKWSFNYLKRREKIQNWKKYSLLNNSVPPHFTHMSDENKKKT